MKDEYDFANMKRDRNPHAARLKQPITIRIDQSTVGFFKNMAAEVGLPYQNLINLYLRDCAQKNRKLNMKWNP